MLNVRNSLSNFHQSLNQKNLLSQESGFTLVELMIVVAIIGILASVAVPNFQKYQAKARQTEAKAALSGIFTAEQAYSIDNAKFTADLSSTGAGFALDTSAAAKSKRSYTVGFPGTDGTHFYSGKGPTDPSAKCGVNATTSATFVACADGSIFKSLRDTWTITDLKTLTPACDGIDGAVTAATACAAVVSAP